MSTSTVTTPTPAVGSSAPAGQRLASSVRLPLLVGLVSLLLLAVALGGLAGQDRSKAGVPRAVLDADVALAVGAAGSVRRALNEGSDDLQQVVEAVEGRPLTERLLPVLRATGTVHRRYLGVGLVRAADGEPVLVATGDRLAAPLGALPDDRRVVRVLDDGRLVQTVPLQDGRGLLVAAVYDPAYLVPALRPNRGLHVLDDRGRAVAAPGGRGLNRVPADTDVQDGADRAERAPGVLARTVPGGGARVVAYAPVLGAGPAARAGLVVVADRVVPSGDGPRAAAFRLGGLFAALLLAGAALAAFGLLQSAVLGPVLGLRKQAERVAYGDLSAPVVVSRADETGTVGRALERLRLALIRSGVQDVTPHDVDPPRTET